MLTGRLEQKGWCYFRNSVHKNVCVIMGGLDVKHTHAKCVTAASSVHRC